MTKERKLKPWQGWLLFGGTLVVVFLLGLLAASVTERRAETQTLLANRVTEIAPDEARNPLYEPNYPREYQTGSRPPTPPSAVVTTALRPSTY